MSSEGPLVTELLEIEADREVSDAEVAVVDAEAGLLVAVQRLGVSHAIQFLRVLEAEGQWR